MADANLNALWGRCIAEELDRAGCRQVVGCPGSRNSPLLFALSAVFGERLVMHVDERSAAYHALGMAKALRAPVAVCVTSGTAVANLLPAVCEADAAEVPLILLTADRPWELQGCGAPQTMAQQAVFGGFADTVEIGEPQATESVVGQLRARIALAVASARRPVHCNIPLRDPLPPIADGWTAPPLNGGRVTVPGPPPARCHVDLALGRPGRGLIVAGSAESVPAEHVARLAVATGFPVLADACSGLRRPAVPNLVACPDARYGQPPATPDVIIRIGPPPLTRAGYEWLGRQRCPQIVLGSARNDDFLASATHRLAGIDGDGIDGLIAALGRAEASWTAAWMNRLPATAGWNATAVAAQVCAASGFAHLWLASSMPIRDANLVLAPRAEPQRVLSSRGLNGIDGTIASFLGVGRATGAPGLCLIGDLAFLHDLTALVLAGAARGAVVIVNNGGGAIFDALPVSQVAGYRSLVRTDHDLDFAHAAAQFRLPYRRCVDGDALAGALAEAASGERLLVIECDLRGRDGIAAHRAALESARV